MLEPIHAQHTSLSHTSIPLMLPHGTLGVLHSLKVLVQRSRSCEQELLPIMLPQICCFLQLRVACLLAEHQCWQTGEAASAQPDTSKSSMCR